MSIGGEVKLSDSNRTQRNSLAQRCVDWRACRIVDGARIGVRERVELSVSLSLVSGHN